MFNVAKINDQRSNILSSSDLTNQIQKGYLEWQDEGMHVTWIPDRDGPYRILAHPQTRLQRFRYRWY